MFSSEIATLVARLGSPKLHQPAPYTYCTARGLATVCRGDHQPVKVLGNFKSEAAALEACQKHFARACNFLKSQGKALPEAIYI